MIENKLGFKTQQVQLDNGGEFKALFYTLKKMVLSAAFHVLTL